MIVLGWQFGKFEDLETAIEKYEKEKLVKVWISHCRTIEGAKRRGLRKQIKPELRYAEITYSCVNGGKYRSHSKGIRPNQSTCRQGCEFRISLKSSDDGQFLEVVVFKEEHNHELNNSPNKKRKKPPKKLKIEDSESSYEFEELYVLAKAALVHSYCPYSKFPVASALLAEDGRVFTGVNVENASFGLTICAEKNAITTAVTEGYRKFKCIVIVTGSDNDKYLGPCGSCRQFLAEFGTNIEVYLTKKDGSYIKSTVAELLPHTFTPDAVLGQS